MIMDTYSTQSLSHALDACVAHVGLETRTYA